jgi:hypothetical protein
MMNTMRRLSGWTVLALVPATAVATDAAGVYKGSYAGFDGADRGAVTIVVTDEGRVVCDFRSTPGSFSIITAGGSVSAAAPFLALDCLSSRVSNGSGWYAATDASSCAGGSISGTWTAFEGPISEDPPPTGSFQANWVSPLVPIDPAAMAGLWVGDSLFGAFTLVPAKTGLVVSWMGMTNESRSTPGGTLIGPPLGSPLWLLSDVGPATILPGDTVTVNVVAPRLPTPDLEPPAVDPSGSLSITFVDCHAATATFQTENLTTVTNLTQLAGIADAPGC